MNTIKKLTNTVNKMVYVRFFYIKIIIFIFLDNNIFYRPFLKYRFSNKGNHV